MTSTPSAPFGLTYSAAQDTVRVELSGDLDHLHADLLLAAVDEVLTVHAGLGHLRLDCAGLSAVDSSGLAALLMVRRRTGGAGADLHLDARTVQLDRLLEVTGTLEYLTAPAARPQARRRAGRGPARGGPADENQSAAPPSGVAEPHV
ncbi:MULTISPECIES: STAS domain-containing protein [Streptomyces]|uniref:STAS domain-containing protein n=1 Tax=Streptomyces TaxID=1883 RepID=UPI000AA818B7|nr:STAS domain-containing protein [Streptomyces katrae]